MDHDADTSTMDANETTGANEATDASQLDKENAVNGVKALTKAGKERVCVRW